MIFGPLISKRGFFFHSLPFFQIANNTRHKRKHDDEKHDGEKVFININDAAEIVPERNQKNGPEKRTENIVKKKDGEFHLRDSSDNRSKGPHDRHKPGKDDSFRTMPIIEGLGFDGMGFLEDDRIFPAKEPGSYATPEFIAEEIAEDGRNKDSEKKKRKREKLLRCQKASDKEQAVSRQEKSQKKPGFRKDNPKKPGVPDRLEHNNEINPKKRHE